MATSPSAILRMEFRRSEGLIVFPCQVASVVRNGNSNAKPKQEIYYAIWDTGANISAISLRVVADLGLIPEKDPLSIEHARGRDDKTNAYRISLRVSKDIKFTDVRVGERLINSEDCPSNSPDVLIGMDIISQGDFWVPGQANSPIALFRYPSVDDGGSGLFLSNNP